MLNCIPFAVTQAASFIRWNQISLTRYPEALERDEQNLKQFMNKELQDHRRERGIANLVFRTWKLSYDQITQQYPRAVSMLSLMAMFDRQQIPEMLLQKANESEIDFLNAVEILDDFSLIKKEIETEVLAMHRLVQLSVHVWLEHHHKKGQYEEALTQLTDRFPNGKHENKEICESLLPYTRAVLQYDLNSQSDQIRRADLLHNISWFDWQ